MAAGQIAEGIVEERPVETLAAADIAGDRAHFFAGIGGWDLALCLAGWPDSLPVWTGSCPCQPFSVAGRRKGADDPRHLWPAWCRLIAERLPPIIFGEQVASGAGREWLTGVRADLEVLGYAVGAADLPACSVGAPHIRQRLFWVADAHEGRLGERTVSTEHQRETCGRGFSAQGDGESGRLAHSDGRESGDRGIQRGRRYLQQPQDEAARGLEHAASQRLDGRDDPAGTRGRRGAQDDGWLDNAPGSRRAPEGIGQPGESEGGQFLSRVGRPWDDSYWLACTDGRARRVPTQSALQPLAPGLPGRVGLLRGAGNSIIPQVAAAFVRAYMEMRS